MTNERLMTESDWDFFRPFFKKGEKWGDPARVSFQHLTDLWLVRKKLDWPMVVHCSFDVNGHAGRSYHHRDGFSRATDFHFLSEHSLAIQMMMLEQALSELGLREKVGLGVYPKWNQQGFHFDSRGHEKRWLFDGECYHYGTSREIMTLLLKGT